jgi:hypothetical protein
VRVRLTALLLAFVGFAGGRCEAAPLSDVTVRERASAVIVWSHIGDHRDAIGAGVIVGFAGHRMRVLTARHVVVYGDITIWRDGRLFAGEIARTFAHRDLAIVDAVVPASEQLDVSEVAVAQNVTPGEAIAVWGEDNTGPTLEPGTIVTMHMPALDDPDAPELVNLTCEKCRPGDSGGGVFDQDGRLIAILIARYHTVDGRTVAVVAEPVDPALYAFG